MSKAEDLAAMMVELTLHMDDVRAALVEQGQDGAAAPTAEMGNLIRGINPSPPVNISPPELSGTTVAGGTLTTSAGDWFGAGPMTFAYQWHRAGAPVVGATAASYTSNIADVGIAVFCRVTATNAVASTPIDSEIVTLGDPTTFNEVRWDSTTAAWDTEMITFDHEAT